MKCAPEKKKENQKNKQLALLNLILGRDSTMWKCKKKITIM
jgi:hypothetical protein